MGLTEYWRGALLMALLLSGCQHPYVLTEDHYRESQAVPREAPPADADQSITTLPAPRTVRQPDGDEVWQFSLADALRLGLQHNKRIAVLRYLPAEAGTLLDSQLARFDATVGMGGTWGRTDQDSNTRNVPPIRFDLFGRDAGGFGIQSTSGGATEDGFTPALGANLLEVLKRNATGGLTGIGFAVDYTRQRPDLGVSRFEPRWFSEINLTWQQPLLQGAGVEFNRSPLLIARAGMEQSIHDFDTQVRVLLRDIEQLYWTLYFRYQELYSREVGMKLALRLWQVEKSRRDAGAGAKPDVAQAREQFENFRDARLQALDRVLVTELALRELLGLPPEDGRRLLPADQPATAEIQPTWELAVREAMSQRPELNASRFAMRAAELELFRQRNGLLPDFTVFATYDVTGQDNQFDQSIDRLTDNKFSDWRLGFRYTRPMGERAAHAATRRARLTLGRQRAALREREHSILHELARAYRNLATRYETIVVRRARRQAAAEFLGTQQAAFREGKTSVIVLQSAQIRFADALSDEALAIAQYNQALVDWEFAKGTILRNNNVTLAEERVVQGKTAPTAHPLPLPPVGKDLTSTAGSNSPLLYPSSLYASLLHEREDAQNTTKSAADTEARTTDKPAIP